MESTSPSTNAIELRPYQVEGVKFLMEHKHAALWDEPGLGKTPQAIVAALCPTLIACPNYLVEQWAAEIVRIYPETTVAIAQGTRWDKIAAIAQKAPWTICNIEMLRDYDFPTKFYNTFVMDEAHHFRGHTSQQSKGAQKLAKLTEYVYELTATPMKHESDDFFMQLAILDPLSFSSYHSFVARHCKTYDAGFKVKVVGVRDPEELRRTLKKYALRRTYKQTGLKRPEPIEYPIGLTPSKKWYAVAEELKDKYRMFGESFQTGGEVMRMLRRMTFDLKAVAAKQIAEDNGSTIFYTYYRESAEMLAAALGVPFVHGGITPLERKRIAQSGGSVVATISSISEGVDLSHLSTVVYIEDSYLPGDKVQATARLVRWSESDAKSDRIVRVYHVFVKNSIDTTIMNEVKRRNADEVSILHSELEIRRK